MRITLYIARCDLMYEHNSFVIYYPHPLCAFDSDAIKHSFNPIDISSIIYDINASLLCEIGYIITHSILKDDLDIYIKFCLMLFT